MTRGVLQTARNGVVVSTNVWGVKLAAYAGTGTGHSESMLV
jgi:hypothetical protein